MRDREMSGKMKTKMKMEVQEITFNYFARPHRDLNLYVMMMMAIQKILLSMVSKFVVGLCDGLDACEISRPEILSQSAPVQKGVVSLFLLSFFRMFGTTSTVQYALLNCGFSALCLNNFHVFYFFQNWLCVFVPVSLHAEMRKRFSAYNVY